VKERILATLAYADLFDYPLKKSEIWSWLIKRGKGESKDSKKEFEASLKDLLKTKSLQIISGFYFLSGRKEIVKIRKKREKVSKEKIEKAKKIAKVLQILPWIRLIGITGGLARNNANSGDDIDFFIITQIKRLWLTRGLVALFLTLTGLYRRKKKIKDQICPNMLIDESNLEIKPHDLFMSHEVALMKPLVNKNEIYDRFLRTNLWAKKFLPNLSKWSVESDKKDKKQEPLLKKKTFFDWLEISARKTQLSYMKSKRTKEIVTSNLIKFHPEDVRERVLGEYQKRLQKLKIS